MQFSFDGQAAARWADANASRRVDDPRSMLEIPLPWGFRFSFARKDLRRHTFLAGALKAGGVLPGIADAIAMGEELSILVAQDWEVRELNLEESHQPDVTEGSLICYKHMGFVAEGSLIGIVCGLEANSLLDKIHRPLVIDTAFHPAIGAYLFSGMRPFDRCPVQHGSFLMHFPNAYAQVYMPPAKKL